MKYFTTIMNQILKSGIFSGNMKRDEKTEISYNYRPISLLTRYKCFDTMNHEIEYY